MPQSKFRPGVVTIGIPTYNRSQLLVRAVRSALAQTYQKIEIVISDDASTDDTIERMRKLDDPRIVFLRLPENVGIARNTDNCLKHATGELLLILNDDDQLEPTAIEKLSEPFRTQVYGVLPEKVAITWCPCSVQTAEGQLKWITDAGPSVEFGFDTVLGMFDGIRGPRFCGIMVRTTDARAVGGYTARYGPIPDVGNWTQIAVRGGYSLCIQEPLARYTAHSSSCTGTSKTRSWQEAGENIFNDLADNLEKIGDQNGLKKLKAARRNFISGLLASIVMQAMGRPGWVKFTATEVMRVPQYFFTPMVARRIIRDGWKLVRTILVAMVN